MEKNSIKKPVVFFDLETTGKDKDTNNIRIIQISAYKYADTENWEEIGKLKYLLNPEGVEIQTGAIEVHGITPEMVKDCPTFSDIAKEVYDFFDGCDVGGYNNSFFDNSVLYLSFLRSGFKWDYRNLKVYDILQLYRKNFPNTLSEVYKRLTGKELDGAHDADADILGTIKVYQCLKDKGIDFDGDDLYFYKDNLDLIGDFKMRINDKGEKEPYYNFGSHKGKSVEEVGIGMLEWMVNKKADNYPLDTIHVAKQLIKWLEKKNIEKSNKAETDWYERIKNV